MKPASLGWGRWPARLRIAAKAVLLFVALNVAFALINPMPALERLSMYNWLVPGRARFPFGARIESACNLIVDSLDANFAAHEIAQPKAADEFRVALIGDSSVWGVLLKPEQTLAGQLNAMGLTAQGKRVRAYNLGYPDFSTTKDLLILRRALDYQPDAVIWLVTPNSLPTGVQATHAIVRSNPDDARAALGNTPGAAGDGNLLDRTIVGRRRELADLARLQLCGVYWAATGVDQDIRSDYERWTRDLDNDEGFAGMRPPTLAPGAMAYDVLDRGAAMAHQRGVPLLVVNEPIAVSQGRNGDVRYNAFYPRWAYDQHRAMMAQRARAATWRYLDAWNLVDADEFTNSPVHLSPAGTHRLAEALAAELSGLERIR